MNSIFIRLTALTLLVVLLSLHEVKAQRVIVNGNGEKLIMYPDGSWRLADAGDSILLRQNLQKSEVNKLPSEQIDNSVARNAGEEEEYILRQWNDLYFRIRDQEKKAQDQFRKATNAQFKANELLQNAENNKKMIESERLASLQDSYDKAVENLRVAKLRQKSIVKLLDNAKSIAGQPAKKIQSKMPQVFNQFENYLAQYDPYHNMQDLSKSGTGKKDATPANPYSSAGKTKSQEPQSMDVKSGDSKNAGSKSTAQKAALIRPASNRIPVERIKGSYKSEPFQCKFTQDTIDANTKTHHIALEQGLIFTHTDPDLRPYFKNKELITCYGALSKIGAYVYFTINFQIASSHSQGNFGGLESSSLLRLRLLNGKYVSLYNLKADRGHIDPYSGNTIFTGQYSLGKDEIKLLSSSSLDKIRILWTTGYEDYDVYKIDFFLDQLHCLLSK